MRHRGRLALIIGIAIIGIAIIALGGIFILTGRFEPLSGQGGAPSSGLRRQAPGFALKDASGKVHRLEDFKNTPVIIHFWASWCPPCLDELPRWAELAIHYQKKRIQLIAISLDQKWEDAQKVMPSDKLPPGLLSLLDSRQDVPDKYGTYQYPETYLLDRDHRIVEKWVGPQNWESEKIRSFIDRLIAAS
jgi:peroxiredoxin